MAARQGKVRSIARPTGFSCGRFLQQSASAPSLAPDRGGFSAAASMVLSPSGVVVRRSQSLLGRSLKERCNLLEHQARVNSEALSYRQEAIDAARKRKQEKDRRAEEARAAYLAMLSPRSLQAALEKEAAEEYDATTNTFTARWQKTLSEAQGAPCDMFQVYSSKRGAPALLDPTRDRVSMTAKIRALEENLRRNRSMMDDHQATLSAKKTQAEAQRIIQEKAEAEREAAEQAVAPDPERERRKKILFGGPGGSPMPVSDIGPQLVAKRRTFGCVGKASLTPRLVGPASTPFAGTSTGFFNPQQRGGLFVNRMHLAGSNAVGNAETLISHRIRLNDFQPA